MRIRNDYGKSGKSKYLKNAHSLASLVGRGLMEEYILLCKAHSTAHATAASLLSSLAPWRTTDGRTYRPDRLFSLHHRRLRRQLQWRWRQKWFTLDALNPAPLCFSGRPWRWGETSCYNYIHAHVGVLFRVVDSNEWDTEAQRLNFVALPLARTHTSQCTHRFFVSCIIHICSRLFVVIECGLSLSLSYLLAKH